MREGSHRSPSWLALLAAAFLWTSADGARRPDSRPPRPPSDLVATQPIPPLDPAHPHRR